MMRLEVITDSFPMCTCSKNQNMRSSNPCNVISFPNAGCLKMVFLNIVNFHKYTGEIRRMFVLDQPLDVISFFGQVQTCGYNNNVRLRRRGGACIFLSKSSRNMLSIN